MAKDKIIVICGPTASGKTSLGINLANKINGEIISADSMQIYKDFSIGSSKPTEEERKQAPHHLVDFVDADKRYSVADYKEDCQKVIEDILSRGKVPIIVGGTGLYIDSIIYNIKYLQISTDYTYTLHAHIDKNDVKIHFSINDQLYQVSSMTRYLETNNFTYTFEGLTHGDDVKYYIEASDSSSHSNVDPTCGSLDPHHFVVS